ncbi:hypothetical protein BRD02_00530 [Halobacteriales archaeon QS_8_69_73]|nr:MAG: hypothetical protein BRD02_00530 [Halobacteriales archaeon QS_8_69_73]
MTRSARRRLAAFAGGLTVAFGLFIGLVGGLVRAPGLGGLTYLATERSGPAAVLGLRFVEWAGYPAAVALYLLLPVAVAVVSRRSDRVPLHPAWAVAAVAPALPATVALLLIPFGVFVLDRALVLTVLTTVGVALLVAVLVLNEFARTGDDGGRTSPLAAFGNVAFVALFVGVASGNLFAGPAGALVQQEDRRGVPSAQFDVVEVETDDGTVVVFTLAEYVARGSGGPIPTEDLRIAGEGFANVSEAGVTEPGPWPASEASDDGGVVRSGDSVAVGASDDCRIRIIHDDGRTATLADHECG